MNFKERESWLGINEKNFRQKFIFSQQETADGFYFDRFQPTPSQLEGLSELDQNRTRSIACQMIMEAGIFLRLPITTVISAQTILQFFYQRCSFLRQDFRDIVMGSLFLACKCEQTLRRSAHIALVFDQVFKIHEKQKRPVRVADVNNYEFKSMQAKVLESERLILLELGFEVYRLLETPHRYMNSLFLEFKGHKRTNQIVRKAWGYLNDSYRTRVCCQYPGQIIATACIQLSLRVLGIPAPSVPWWCLLQAGTTMIEDIMVDILSLYERCDTFSVVQEALTRAGSSKNIQHVFPVTYYRRIVLMNRQAQRLRIQQEEKRSAIVPTTISELQPPAISATQNKIVKEETATHNTNTMQEKTESDRSRSRRKEKKRNKHRDRSRSRERNDYKSHRDHGKGYDRSRSRSKRRREDSRDKKKRKQRKQSHRRSDGEDSKQNITKSSNIQLNNTQTVNNQAPILQTKEPQETNVKASVDKETLKKQIHEQMKARLLKKPQPSSNITTAADIQKTVTDNTSQLLPGSQSIRAAATQPHQEQQDKHMMAELRAKILKCKQQKQPNPNAGSNPNEEFDFNT